MKAVQITNDVNGAELTAVHPNPEIVDMYARMRRNEEDGRFSIRIINADKDNRVREALLTGHYNLGAYSSIELIRTRTRYTAKSPQDNNYIKEGTDIAAQLL